VDGWLDELRITKGYARYTANFECPMAAFANDELVTVSPKKLGMVVKSEVVPQPVLLLHCNGMNASTAVRDEMGHTVTCNGNAQISTAQYKFGGSSALFDGTTDYLTTPSSAEWAFGTDDFTIDFWVRFNSLTPYYQSLMGTCGDAANNAGWYLYVFRNGEPSTFAFYTCLGSGWSMYQETVPITLTTATWYHLSIVRASGTLKIYLNGIKQATTQNTSWLGNITSTGVLYIGSDKDLVASAALNGYLDEIRITKGFALWTTDFNVPDKEAPSDYNSVNNTEPQIDYNTKLLMHFDGYDTSTDIRDECKHLVTVSGNAKIKTNQYEFGGSSCYFDGTATAFLMVPDSNDWNFGNGDFTIDCWIRTSGDGCVVQSPYGITGANGYNTWVIRVTSGFASLMGGWNISNYVYITSVTRVDNGAWHHIAGVRNGNNWYLFVDGKLEATAYGSFTIVYPPNYQLHVGQISVYSSDAGQSYPFTGWIDELRITKGLARWTTDFTPPTSPYSLVDSTKTINTTIAPRTVDPYTKLLMHCNGYSGSTAFKDECGKAITAVGTAQHSVAQSKFGNSSCLLDGNSDYLELADSDDWNLNTVDFTIDCWVIWNASSEWAICRGTSGTDLWIWRYNGTNFYFYQTSGGIDTTFVNSTITFNTGVWYHLAVVRFGSTFMLFVNGQKVGTGTSSTTVANHAGTLEIGARVKAGATNIYLNGWTDEVRISKGIARWLGDFTPPTREYALTEATVVPSIQVARDADVYTKLLLHCNDYNDELGKVVTPVGGVSLDYYTKKFGDYAVKFDGTSGYLSIPDSADFSFGTGDFTIECWVSFDSLPANGTVASIYTQTDAGAVNYISFGLYNSSGIYKWFLYVEKADANWIGSIQLTTTVTTGVWYHVALVRYGSIFRIFQNGVQVGFDYISSRDMIDLSTPIEIGRVNQLGGADWLTGRIDEYRVSKGIARYTANFTPQATPFVLATYKEVSLLQDSVANGYYRTQDLVDLQDLPAGQNLKYKVNLANANQRKIQGVGLYWR
jgi:hypothetical protein